MDDDEVLVDPYEIRRAPKPHAGPVTPYWVDRGALPQEPDATGVQNWDFFDGAILAVGVADTKRFVIQGSGVMVAPGVVITASHIINAHYNAVLAGQELLHCIAVRRDHRAELWTLRRWRWPESRSDISF